MSRILRSGVEYGRQRSHRPFPPGGHGDVSSRLAYYLGIYGYVGGVLTSRMARRVDNYLRVVLPNATTSGAMERLTICPARRERPHCWQEGEGP